MSHFTVLVTGPNVEEQLQPYHEFECTGEDDQYVSDIDETEESLKDFEEHGEGRTFLEFIEYWTGATLLTSPPLPSHKFNYILQNEDGSYKVIRRTNPNSKWDWYQIGGRWSGFFKLKPEGSGALGDRSLLMRNEPPVKSGRADVAYKGDIDFAGMEEDARLKATERYDFFESLISSLPENERSFIPWKECWKHLNTENIDEVRAFYNSQPVIELIAKLKIGDNELSDHLQWNTDDYAVSRDEFIERGVDSSWSVFALLHRGEWISRGDMGWWGCVSNEVDDEEGYRKYVRTLIHALPDDTLLTLVDCHI